MSYNQSVSSSVSSIQSTQSQQVQQVNAGTMPAITTKSSFAQPLVFRRKHLPAIHEKLRKETQNLLRLNMAEQALKGITRSLMGMKQEMQQQLDRKTEEPNEEYKLKMARAKDKVEKHLNTQLYGEYVLSSTLNYNLNRHSHVGFNIDGLDFERHRYVEEKVTIRMDQKLSILHFKPTLNQFEQVSSFNYSLAFNNLFAKKSNKELTFYIADSEWRDLPKQVGVLGEGHRFPSGQLIPVTLMSVERDFVEFLHHGVNTLSSDTVNDFESFIHQAKNTYQRITQLKDATQHSIHVNSKKWRVSTPADHTFKQMFTHDNARSLYRLNTAHAYLNRTTALSLLK
ncbi:hypothetical protein N9R79_01515 [Vibrio sp.]|nr:hypothetical protein [Vibrio sp.]